MAERTKIVYDHEYYYVGPTGVVPLCFTYDPEAGDKLDRREDGARLLHHPNGHVIEIAPYWAWNETRARKVKTQEPPPA